MSRPARFLRHIEPARRNVGSIGFQHQAVERQCDYLRTQTGGALERHGAAESQHSPDRAQRLGLLLAPDEGMGNGSRRRQLAQMAQHGIDGTPCMQQHGQAISTRKSQLPPQQRLLACPHGGVVPAPVVGIETDLAHGDQMRVVLPLAQVAIEPLQRLGHLTLRQIQGVKAERIPIAGTVGQLAHGGKVADIHRRDHDSAHTGGSRLLPHPLRPSAGREFRGIQMAMGIDPESHACRSRCPAPGPVRPAGPAPCAAGGCSGRRAGRRG